MSILQKTLRIFYSQNLRVTCFIEQQIFQPFWSDTIKPHTQGGIMKNRKGVEDGTEIQCRIQGRRAE
ncbi:hypothetical protein ACTQ34_17800, partial [Agathobaculum sp. LCP25S3_E8]|uniref:hypothetical protein n=1 Tax=Agathobaculum sp. LCP25S3_E8 TaxID=3438735 RepID=UPI003F934E56